MVRHAIERMNCMKTKTKRTILAILSISVVIWIIFVVDEGSINIVSQSNKTPTVIEIEPVDIDKLIEEKDLKTIYLAGGCFWGVEEYMSRIAGVYDATSGYANGKTENPSYQDVLYKDTGHAETVRVVYDPEQVTLEELLDKLYKVVDPTSLNQQGNDVGTQYRTGIYYVHEEDKTVVDEYIQKLQANYTATVVVENQPLDNFYLAEDYHQDYLKKNPNGYCHINLNHAGNIEDEIAKQEYTVPTATELTNLLTPQQYEVTQNNGTERAFTNEYNDNKEPGIYVDVVTGEPLFSSSDKYNSGSGWPSFTKPISQDVILETADDSHGMDRTEVKSQSGETHLGHVFNDGPKSEGGLRYCINSSSLKFIPYNDMPAEGYGYLQHIVAEGYVLE